MNPVGLLFVVIGLFALAGAICNRDWFMNSRKARFFLSTFGRTGVRIFYGSMGSGFAILGALEATEMTQLFDHPSTQHQNSHRS